MGKILPVLLALVGTVAGVGAGLLLMPAPDPEMAATSPDCVLPSAAVEHEAPPKDEETTPEEHEFVKLSNQFVVPVMDESRVVSLVVASLSLEVATGSSESVYSREPKLRDVLLQVMFDHANIGGFEGTFTSGERMRILRRALKEAAHPILGDVLHDVLVTEIARQDT